MSLDPTDVEEEKKVETKRRIDWGGLLDDVKEVVVGDMRRDAPDGSLMAHVHKALDAIERAYQTGDEQEFWATCRQYLSNASSSPFRRILDMRLYMNSELLDQLTRRGCLRVQRKDPYLFAAENGLTKILELFPLRLVQEDVIDAALQKKCAETLEFVLQKRRPRPSLEWFDDRIDQALFDSSAECVATLFAATPPDEYRYLPYSGDAYQLRCEIFSRANTMAIQKGSVALMRLLIERGCRFDWRAYVYGRPSLILPGNAELLKYALERDPHPDSHRERLALFERAIVRRDCLDCAEVLWEKGGFAPFELFSQAIYSKDFGATVRYLLSKDERPNWRAMVRQIVTSYANNKYLKLQFLRDECGIDVPELLKSVFLSESHEPDFWTRQVAAQYRDTAHRFKRMLEKEADQKRKKPRIE